MHPYPVQREVLHMSLKRFDVGGVSYGPAETAELRRALIERRDGALKSNNWGDSVLFSHVIGMLHAIGTDLWGEEFKDGLPEDTKSVK